MFPSCADEAPFSPQGYTDLRSKAECSTWNIPLCSAPFNADYGFRRQQQRFLLNCSTWNIRFYRAAPSCSSTVFLGDLQDRVFALFHMEQPHKELPAQKACAGAARCAVSRKGALKQKDFNKKNKKKTPFCIDNPHGFCYNITNVQKRLRPFSAVSFLSQFRPLAGSGQKSGFLAGDRRT